jgi:hypothetical protein
VRPGDWDTPAAAHAGDALDVVERLGAVHPEAVDDKELLGVVHPCAQRGRKRVTESEVDADDPARSKLDVFVRIDRPQQALDRERENARNAELWKAVDAGLALVRQVALLELRAALRADVPGV